MIPTSPDRYDRAVYPGLERAKCQQRGLCKVVHPITGAYTDDVPHDTFLKVGRLNKHAQSLKVRPGQTAGRDGLRRILDILAPEPGEEAASLYLSPGSGLDALGGLGPDATRWRDALAGLDRQVLESGTGLAVMRSGSEGLVVVPPFPLTEDRAIAGWDPSPLLANVDSDHIVGVVLLRLGRSSVGVFQGDALLSSKTDARYVKGKHHAGGTSQRRFQRIREGQARKMYDKTCDAVRAQLTPHARELEYVVLGGDRITLGEFLKVCPHLRPFRDITLQRRLNIRDPKRDTLEQVPELLRESRLYPVRFQVARELPLSPWMPDSTTNTRHGKCR